MRKKLFVLWFLIALSVFLTVLPHPLTHALRLSLLAPLIPVKEIANEFRHLAQQAFDGSPRTPDQEADLKREVLYLRERVRQLATENMDLKLQLQALTQFQNAVSGKHYIVLMADVLIPVDPSEWRRSLTVAKGSRHGVAPGMTVIWGNHLIGRVVAVGPLMSQVLLITDGSYKVAAVALPEKLPDKEEPRRTIGVLMGTSSDYCEFQPLSHDTTLQKDWLVTTTEDPLSGIPKGLLLGKIDQISSEYGPAYRAKVTPLLHLRGLESVLILKRASAQQ